MDTQSPQDASQKYRIVITGCSGRVGQKVVALALNEGHVVIGVDIRSNDELPIHPNFTFIPADLRDFDTTLKLLRGMHAIIHLAALPDPGDYLYLAHNTNVVLSWNVLRAAAELKITRVAQASSVNAIGLVYSAGMPTFDYFPIDEEHPCRPDEPYGLSKQICEQQADTIVRRYPFLRIASLRLHWFQPNPEIPSQHLPLENTKQLWGWVQEDEVARACLLSVTSNLGEFRGHERFFIVAPETISQVSSVELAKTFWPNVKLMRELKGRESFFDCSKAEKMLGWRHGSRKSSSNLLSN